MIVLDTSAIIELIRGTQKGKEIQQYLLYEAAAMSAITLNEISIGVQGKEREIIQEFIKTMHILPFDEAAAQKSVLIEETLSKKGKPIGKLDIFIASICMIHDLQLITADKDLKQIDDLKVILV
ncbi:type II toxin-antitoxin system VapC family toxin [Candidatus Woesearchaeota archaeon]|nr:type II toxin-antitoxin system VapC family toxin [Candidatus Woesearchaeota archaeon]